MEQDLHIHFYTSAGKGMKNIWIEDSNGQRGVRFEANNPKEAGDALQKYLEILLMNKNDFQEKKEKMCRTIPDCDCCDLFGVHAGCDSFIKNHPEESKKIVNEWAAQHLLES